MVDKEYYKMETPKGVMYIQLRYHTPANNYSYEGLTISISSSGNVRQSVQDLTEDDKIYFFNTYKLSSQQEFRIIQDQNILPINWQTTYDGFVREWEKYFQLKRKSVETTRKLHKQVNWDYEEMLENEYKVNGVYEQKVRLSQLETEVLKRNSPSLEDIFREARHNASIAYTKN